jgi:formylglycine-generating enzyme required for sulfatase activity
VHNAVIIASLLTVASSAIALAQPDTLRRVRNAKDGQMYVWIPPGTVMMGCSPEDKACEPDESPRHRIALSRGFWIGRTEMTVAGWRKHRTAPDEKADDHPIGGVGWQEAADFCRAVGGRLPTEAEWEYAARAGTEASRYGQREQIAWYNPTPDVEPGPDNRSRPVARKLPNNFGLYDMIGNVWEWVADFYEADYYARSPESDPKGPAGGAAWVIRGGSWRSGPSRSARASDRNAQKTTSGREDVGFRCVIDQLPQP